MKSQLASWAALAQIDLAQLVADQAGAGDIAGALVTARAVENETIRSLALRAVGAVQIERGDPLGAIAMVYSEIETLPRHRPDDYLTGSGRDPAATAWHAGIRPDMG